MKFFFELGNQYAKKSSWLDFALTKFCLFAMGILVGLVIPQKCKKAAAKAASAVFTATYLPLMGKILWIAKGMKSE